MDLFDYAREELLKKHSPLATRFRPRTLEEFVGQTGLLGPGKILRRLIQADKVSSLILFGPPGSGKTTLAQIIAQKSQAHFVSLSAVNLGVAELREVLKEARERLGSQGTRTVVFLDEIHRFNKAQQDSLLRAVEEGEIILIGATTENPLFAVNKALVSRTRIFRFEPLALEEILLLLQRALVDPERGLGSIPAEASQEALEHLALAAGGDARIALNALELAVTSTPADSKGVVRVGMVEAAECSQRAVAKYDRQGDSHYDIISAFIKSLRGSDPDAALYWMALMIRSGEEPRFITRRMMIFAAEDVGLADPQALPLATSAHYAMETLGMPEGRIPMAQAAIYLALAPKSNSVITAIDRALTDLDQGLIGSVPGHLRSHLAGDAGDPVESSRKYLYPHSFPGHWVRQQYLPQGLEHLRYYFPSESGREPGLFQSYQDCVMEKEKGKEKT